ncbi:MAG: type II secretion system protein GspD [Desulfobacteraceae bacterium 4572_130]|nr:MAG: type II secretion system protein GspD [Desulfobacteraceae bacterium 4572_130]
MFSNKKVLFFILFYFIFVVNTIALQANSDQTNSKINKTNKSKIKENKTEQITSNQREINTSQIKKNKIIPHKTAQKIKPLKPKKNAGNNKTEIQKKWNREYISIDFNNVDINTFIKFISELTGKNFIVDPKVKGKVTIISPLKISIKDAYRVFESVLETHGFTTVETGKIIKIIPLPKARTQNIDTQLSSKQEKSKDKLVTRIISLKFADSNEIKKLFKPMVSKTSSVLSYNDTNTLIITDILSNIERLLKIIKIIDIKDIGKKISVIPIEYADAKKLTQNLSIIFKKTIKKNTKNTKLDSIVKFVADERTNSVILLASEIRTEQIKDLIALLDKKVQKGEEKIRVYYLEHASAENLVKVLQNINSSKNNKTSGRKNAPIMSGHMKITADKSTNSLIITADKEDYPVIQGVISKLDIPRPMVYIECLLMEVNADTGLKLGTEWRVGEDFNAGGGDTGAVFGGSVIPLLNGSNLNAGLGTVLPSGFSVGVMGRTLTIGDIEFPSIGAVIQAYKNKKGVNILSTPQILTTDNEEASLIIGKNVPYQTRSAAENATDTYSSYEYKDVGITLKITPHISKDRLVRLNVFQKITKLDSGSGTMDRPTTLKREFETTLIVKDGHTIVIGGLIDEILTKKEYSMPCLGNIPLAGYLFKTTSDESEKTNLYVFLTPKVIQNANEAQKINDIKKTHIDSIKNGSIKLYK